MKRMEVTPQKIGENTFYLKPFPAFVAANLSGELAALITPMLGSLAPLLGKNGDGDKRTNSETATDVLDMDVEEALPALSTAFSALTGDKIERLMGKLLIDNRNISVECEETNWEVKQMNRDLADEIFCGDVQDMFTLCWYVIKLNFSGFFKKLGAQFGSLLERLPADTPSTADGETSTSRGSQS